MGGFGPPASLFIVGEVSDKEDDIMGQPFSNRAGQHLFNLIQKANIDYETIYFTNTVKCQTNKVEQNNVDACKSWLWKELNLIQPKIVLTLGALPTKLLLKDLKSNFKMKDVAGQAHTVSYIDASIFPWYHPNYILNRGKAFDEQTIEFFIKIKEHLNENKIISKEVSTNLENG